MATKDQGPADETSEVTDDQTSPSARSLPTSNSPHSPVANKSQDSEINSRKANGISSLAEPTQDISTDTSNNNGIGHTASKEHTAGHNHDNVQLSELNIGPNQLPPYPSTEKYDKSHSPNGAAKTSLTALNKPPSSSSLSVMAGSSEESTGWLHSLSCFPPRLFERVNWSAWFEPRFDSSELEGELEHSFYRRTRQRFRLALAFIGFSALCWTVFFATSQCGDWVGHIAGTLLILLITTLTGLATHTKAYSRWYQVASGVYACVVLIALISSPLHYAVSDASTPHCLSPFGVFILCAEFILIVYTCVPVPVSVAAFLSLVASALLETLSLFALTKLEQTALNETSERPSLSGTHICGKVLLHLCVHGLGAYVHVMASVRRHSTFWTIGRSTVLRGEIKVEKKLTDDMINSLMPPKVAKEVMKMWNKDAREEAGGGDEGEPGEAPFVGEVESSVEGDDDKKIWFGRGRLTSKGGKGRAGSVAAVTPAGSDVMFCQFFWMEQMNNVSILFADIVGFTKMSSNKTAEHLVTLLNNLFARFDKLCTESGCEKISTLGDCYYCVSGCPVRRDDHAKCCVKMGLAMIKAIKEFDEEYHEDVDMRVGVHTGSVLCGIVGTRRFKFDVWSYDVDLANLMESTGTPGEVHVTEETYSYLGDNEYNIRPGEIVETNTKIRHTVENYDMERSAFVVQQVQHSNSVKTYFIKSPDLPVTINQEPAPKNTRADDSKAILAADVESTELFNREQPKTKFSGKTMPIDYESHPIQSHLLGHRGKARLRRGSDLSSDMDSKTGSKKKTYGFNIGKKSSEFIHDSQLVDSIREENICEEYLYSTPVHPITQSFHEAKREKKYKHQFRQDLAHTTRSSDTLARPRYSGFADVIVLLVFFILFSAAVLPVFPLSLSSPATPYFALSAALLLSITTGLAVLLQGVGGVLNMGSDTGDGPSAWCWLTRKAIYYLTGWIWSNTIGAILLVLPAGLVYISWAASMPTLLFADETFLVCAVIVSIIYTINLNMISSWTRSVVATVVGAVLVVIVFVPACPTELEQSKNGTISDMMNNVTGGSQPSDDSGDGAGELYSECILGSGVGSRYQNELVVSIALFLLLIWMINRRIEAGSRLAFFGHLRARTERSDVLDEKRKADWLLANILPGHVAEQMKTSTFFSRSHRNVAVVFISMENFGDFYEETFLGGKENLRVLNEIFSDYEALFLKSKYKDVEKIKTIGSTFMAASGLNEAHRSANEDPKEHLYAMMEFCLEILEVMKNFNKAMFSFNFVLKVGYNVGDVVSGVIGTTKLHYDIWGNTVNVASRMYSMGVNGRIQVTADTAQLLEDRFDFEYRGEVEVKGKGRMKVYLLIGRKGGSGAAGHDDDSVFTD